MDARKAGAALRLWLGAGALAVGLGVGHAAVGGSTEEALRSADRAERGQMLFAHNWQPHDRLSRSGDGLGPLYNERSCAACHRQSGLGGSGSNAKNVALLSAIPLAVRRVAQTHLIEEIHPGFGHSASVVLHHRGAVRGYDEWRRSVLAKANAANDLKILVDATDLFGDKLRAGYKSIPWFSTSRRNTPPIFGAGLIDRIPDEAIEAAAAHPVDPKFPEVKGRPAYVRAHHVGRFGWKAQVDTLENFVCSACAGELGLEVPGHHQAPDPLAPGKGTPGLDLNDDDCQALVEYVRELPAPILRPRNDHIASLANNGEIVFHQLGCASCHRGTLGDVHGLYSDLLLHSMGNKLSDGAMYYGPGKRTPGGDGPANASEWRTPPLWGLRDSAPYLHDGRAATIEQAIEAHEGEAAQSRRLYREAKPFERDALHYFLKSLVAPSAADKHTT